MQWFYQNFDEENAKCLYCQGECDVSSSSIVPSNYHENKYTCRTCQEHYTIYIFFSPISDTIFNISTIYSFSCGDFIVSLGPPGRQDLFTIRKHNSYNAVAVPKFEIDLSDKEKLLEKLKTYLLFS